MKFSRKIVVMISMTVMVTAAVAFTTPPLPQDNGFKNLKILPKDISHEQLGHIMHEFNQSLGVKCNFCHAPSKDTAVHHPDFASDEKPEKQIARSMMKMTVKINDKFFGTKHAYIGDSTLTVTCATCHHGQPHPEGMGEGENMKGDRPQSAAPQDTQKQN